MPDGPWPDVIAEALSSVFTLAIGGQRGNYLAIRQICNKCHIILALEVLLVLVVLACDSHIWETASGRGYARWTLA